MAEERAPWRLHEFSWGRQTLSALINGASTGQPLVDNFVSSLGCGDLCILAERDSYKQRTTLREVRIWTTDAQLAAYS